MSDARQVNRMTDKQKFILCTELAKTQDEITRDKLQPGEMAERLSKRLGYEVTKWNIIKAAKYVGVKFPGTNSPIAVLSRRYESLEIRVEQLEMVVTDLRQQLGLKK